MGFYCITCQVLKIELIRILKGYFSEIKRNIFLKFPLHFNKPPPPHPPENIFWVTRKGMFWLSWDRILWFPVPVSQPGGKYLGKKSPFAKNNQPSLKTPLPLNKKRKTSPRKTILTGSLDLAFKCLSTAILNEITFSSTTGCSGFRLLNKSRHSFVMECSGSHEASYAEYPLHLTKYSI